MYSFASQLLTLSFLMACLPPAGIALQTLMLLRKNSSSATVPLELFTRITHFLITACMSVSAFILLLAFIKCDFTLEYVAQYSDTTLPLFYRMTAFWAGQSGSMLFWAWSVAIGGTLFMCMPSYKNLHTTTRLYYCLFFFSIMAFFLLILTVWNNPFIMLSPSPVDGRGLNPLLQNPGMIFHPPLLFLGYGGFVTPGCLALAQAINGKAHAPDNGQREEAYWWQASRPFIFVSWSLLTAGIVLGGWWAYMELGWGGYWAWDPVENASLIPWLVASASLHTAVMESRRGKLQRTNVFLMACTTVSAFFATYLVRSGVVESLHAFGDGGVGTPLLVYTLSFLLIAAVISLYSPSPRHTSQSLENLTSKEGLLIFAVWLLLALAFIILVATIWPVIIDKLRGIANFFPEFLRAGLPNKPMGLEPEFYNRTCLPLFSLLSVLLLFCPCRKWQIPNQGSGFSQPAACLCSFSVTLAVAAGLYLAGIRQPTALLAASCSMGAITGIILLFATNRALLNLRSSLIAHGVHIGLLMMVLGVAFSGPYQIKQTLELGKQEEGAVGEYTVLLKELYEGKGQINRNGRPNYVFLEAELLVKDKKGNIAGTLAPQRRQYANFENQTYAEVSTLFSLGKELYATLLSVDGQGKAALAVNINPLINWLWIGGTLMCLFPLFSLARARRKKIGEYDEESALEPDAEQ
ncbi:MAG: cytochrome c biogenesis protein CcsA [Desulfovibrio sp.]|jgi:cytochrome c-type biogenesis protein CcmF|nr:cytochrome c biogenesis protein CcsA [Desulfovibrio sp.]